MIFDGWPVEICNSGSRKKVTIRKFSDQFKENNRVFELFLQWLIWLAEVDMVYKIFQI